MIVLHILNTFPSQNKWYSFVSQVIHCAFIHYNLMIYALLSIKWKKTNALFNIAKMHTTLHVACWQLTDLSFIIPNTPMVSVIYADISSRNMGSWFSFLLQLNILFHFWSSNSFLWRNTHFAQCFSYFSSKVNLPHSFSSNSSMKNLQVYKSQVNHVVEYSQIIFSRFKFDVTSAYKTI